MAHLEPEADESQLAALREELVRSAESRRLPPAGYTGEDLAQEVMLIVYRKADQIRDRALFRAWLFKVARSLLCRHYGQS